MPSLMLRGLTTARQIVEKVPISRQGAIILLLAALCLFKIALPSADLVVAICCSFIIGLLVALSCICFFQARHLRKRLTLQTNSLAAEALAGQPVPHSHVFSNSNLPTGFQLEVNCSYQHPGTRQQSIVLLGRSESSQRTVNTIITFPHRGLWTQTTARITLRDRFGLTAVSWQQQNLATTAVYPASLEFPKTDFITTNTSDGELNIPTSTIQGDYYDYKEYSPADSFSKVLWKLFARSGELYVRHPEPVASDFGRIAIYLIADAKQDFVAAAVRDLLETLTLHNKPFAFGTDAMFLHADLPATNLEQALNLIAATVWDQDAGSGKGFAAFAQYMLSADNISTFVVVGANGASWAQQLPSHPTQGSHLQLIGVSRRATETFKTKKLRFFSNDPTGNLDQDLELVTNIL